MVITEQILVILRLLQKLNGYGEYVFKNVPCVVTSFNVDLPQDVDYMKTNIQGEVEGTPDTAPGTWVPAQSLMAVTLQPITAEHM